MRLRHGRSISGRISEGLVGSHDTVIILPGAEQNSGHAKRSAPIDDAERRLSTPHGPATEQAFFHAATQQGTPVFLRVHLTRNIAAANGRPVRQLPA